MKEVTEIFDQLLRDFGSVDLAEAEFKRLIADDEELHSLYHDWCEETGHTERHGFTDYAAEYIANQNSIWDTLTDEIDG